LSLRNVAAAYSRCCLMIAGAWREDRSSPCSNALTISRSSLVSRAASQLVTRFIYDLPPNHVLRQANRPVLAVSPDGRQFAYNTLDGLYLRSMDALDARLLPGTQELTASPVFSPDGQSVAYFSGPGRQLKRVAISGGSPVALVALTAPPASVNWSTDGTIFFATDEGILRVSANGGTPELVIPAGEREALDSPQLLPDGDSLLFTVGDGRSGFAGRWSEAQIVVESLTTGVRTPLLPGSDARYLSTGHLVYALADGLFGVAFDADSLTVVGGSVSLVQGVAQDSRHPQTTAPPTTAPSSTWPRARRLAALWSGSTEPAPST